MLFQVSVFNRLYIAYWAKRIISEAQISCYFQHLSFKKDVEDSRNSPYVEMASIIVRAGKIEVLQAAPSLVYQHGDLYVDVHNEFL